VDEGLLEFVKKAEGFAPTAKWDYKQYTYGYGTKAPGEGATITEAEAEVPLKQELAEAAALVEKFAPNAPKGVKQALTDLTFNAGTGWETGNLGAEIKAGNYAAAAKSILRYNHAGGQVLDGLTIRRQSEASWFNDPL
jgi:lysozyme